VTQFQHPTLELQVAVPTGDNTEDNRYSFTQHN